MVRGCICSRGRTQALLVVLTLWLVAHRCTQKSYMRKGNSLFFLMVLFLVCFYLVPGIDSCPLRYVEVLCGRWVYLQPEKDTSFACRSDSVVGWSSLHPKLIYVER